MERPNTSNCTNSASDSCFDISSEKIANCDGFEEETKIQLIILFAISTAVSLVNLGALLIVYDKDPEVSEIPNLAERQRVSLGEFLLILAFYF